MLHWPLCAFKQHDILLIYVILQSGDLFSDWVVKSLCIGNSSSKQSSVPKTTGRMPPSTSSDFQRACFPLGRSGFMIITSLLPESPVALVSEVCCGVHLDDCMPNLENPRGMSDPSVVHSQEELRQYSPQLVERPALVVANKVDRLRREGATLADRVGRRKYTNDRSRDEEQGAFKR